jgi:uncharacterized membrane protein YGL010W
MRTEAEWFSLYGESHQNPTNVMIHYFCVPLILYTVFGILDALSQAPYLDLPFSLAIPVFVGGGIFYIMLNWKLAALTLSVCAAMIFSFQFYPSATFQLYTHIGLFVVAWVFQFIGHKIEGKKPSFLQDLAFLMIGPLWVFKKLFFGAPQKA